MRILTALALCLVLALLAAAKPVSQGQMDAARSKVYPALVNIAVVYRYFTGGGGRSAPRWAAAASLSAPTVMC